MGRILKKQKGRVAKVCWTEPVWYWYLFGIRVLVTRRKR